jgi:hypothetical protein
MGFLTKFKGAKKMKKLVMRSLIVMLSLMMGLMAVGCDDKPEEDNRVIAEKYRGYWADMNTGIIQDFQGLRISLSEKGFYYRNYNEQFPAYTDGTDLYVKGDFAANDTPFRKVGTFQDDRTLIFKDFSNLLGETYTCIKQD